jgi:hypothetical protein
MEVTTTLTTVSAAVEEALAVEAPPADAAGAAAPLVAVLVEGDAAAEAGEPEDAADAGPAEAAA